MKKNVESNEMKIDSNTKNVNVITFSFASILWISAIAIHFPFAALLLLSYGVPCRVEQSNVYQSVERNKHIQSQWCALNFLE